MADTPLIEDISLLTINNLNSQILQQEILNFAFRLNCAKRAHY